MSIRIEHRPSPLVQGASYLIGSYQTTKDEREGQENQFEAEREIAFYNSVGRGARTAALTTTGALLGGGPGAALGLALGAGFNVGGSKIGQLGLQAAGLPGAGIDQYQAAANSYKGGGQSLADLNRDIVKSGLSPQGYSAQYLQNSAKLQYAGDLAFERAAGRANSDQLEVEQGTLKGQLGQAQDLSGGGGGGAIAPQGPGPLSLEQGGGGPQAQQSQGGGQQPMRRALSQPQNVARRKLLSQRDAFKRATNMRQGEILKSVAGINQQISQIDKNPEGEAQPTWAQIVEQNTYAKDGLSYFRDPVTGKPTVTKVPEENLFHDNPNWPEGQGRFDKWEKDGHSLTRNKDGELKVLYEIEGPSGISAKDRFKAISDLMSKGGELGGGIPFEEATKQVDDIIDSIANRQTEADAAKYSADRAEELSDPGNTSASAELYRRLKGLPSPPPQGSNGIPLATKGGVGQVPGQTYAIILKDGSKRVAEFNGRGYINVRPIPNQGGALSLAESN